MSTMFASMADLLVPGAVRGARLDHYTASGLDALRSKISGSGGGFGHCPEGQRVARLYVEGEGLVMSDSPMEHRTNYPPVWQARGRVLIAGLGLGMILVPILAKATVEAVVVVERSQDVIDLVLPQLNARLAGSEKLTVVCGDIFTWRPAKGSKFDVIYFDIWTDLCTDNLSEMARLHQVFKGYKAPGGWMESWARGELKYRRERERARGW